VRFNQKNILYCLLAGIAVTATNGAVVYAQTPQSNCGSSAAPGQFGPFDYRTDQTKLGIVERYHFTPVVEALISGSTNVLPGLDLDYVLRAFPNHHKALFTLMRYGEKMKSSQPKDLPYPVECYFERALQFRSDDTVARMIYATFLARNARIAEAMKQLEQTTSLAGDNAFTHYNIGLVYFDMKAYDDALRQAHKAIALGFPLTALREQLQAAGKWAEEMSAAASN
jgi:tetratricopeptide (TPR) repeat protein